ncbi:amidohydrolase [Terricaulis silvestris]|uniref:N-substituted formamide deformylase n=1 Tax=Terricaulis silvestris TaxID=2686094 RepID=A0A6I6MLJ8_9CAUL|nr:amidohydrolase [Terricaulis silvestris]QGZ93577.1 N-substituted formamide deformylase precursor [Terricaulis silvestris]
MNLSRRCFAQASLAALAAGCGRSERAPDLIIFGGPIYTGVSRTPRVEALRVRDGRIVFAGALEEATANRGNAQSIDLGGAAAFPGFTDSHVHLTGVGMAALQLDLVGVESIATMLERLRAYAAANTEGPIYGRGWIETHWPERRFPNAADLDAVVSNRIVVLERIDGHAVVVNTAALTLAGINNNTPNPPGGSIERDASGAATGMLIDNAASLVQSRLPSPTPEMMRNALRQAAQLYAQRGWTGISNVSTTAQEATFFEELARVGEMPLHASLYMDPSALDPLFERGPYVDATGLVHVRGVKLYMDGALGSRGAALLSPYSDAPGDGLLVTPVDEIRDLLRRVRAANAQAATHAIGDRGNRLVLDAYRDTYADAPDALRGARWRIEHSQIIAPEDLPRFGQMGVIASMQPSHAISDLHFAPARLGTNRLAGAYAWKALLESGAVIAAGSDAPVEKGDPLIEFYASFYRHDLSGFAGPEWHLDQAVSRDQTLRTLTWGGAFAAFEEADRGTLEVGKFADISAFSVDLMEAEPAAIPTARAVLTVSGGRVTHSAIT